MPNEGEAVILLLSGGLDSICLWNMLLNKYKLNVYPIFFLNPQKKSTNNPQKKSIDFFSKIFKKKYKNLFHEVFIKEYETSFSFSNVKDKNRIWTDLPNIVNNLTYDPLYKLHIPTLINNPSRLGIFSFGAYEYAYALKFYKGIYCNNIYFGIVPEDGVNLRESTLTVLRSINLSMCLMLGNFEWQVSAPIEKKSGFYFTKGELTKFAHKIGLPLDKTWSCGKNNMIHCGVCFNCETRKATFKKIGFSDKTRYQSLSAAGRARKRIHNIIGSFKAKKQPSEQKENVTPHLNSSSIIEISKEVIWHESNQSIYVLKNGVVHQFTDSASFIWKELAANPMSISDIIRHLHKTYDIGEKQLSKDLISFLKIHIKKGHLLVRGIDK